MKIYKREGLKGFTRGYSSMLIRDAPGYALYFAQYDYLKRVFGVKNQ